MEFSASKDSSSANSDPPTAQSAKPSRENGVTNKTNVDVDLLESLKQLSENVKNLFNKEQIEDLLAENDKVEKILLGDSITLMTKLCITENGNGTTDEHTKNTPLDESTESVGIEKMEVTGQLWSELSEQLTNVRKLQSILSAKTALLEQVTDDLRRKNMALEKTEKTLSLEKKKSSEQEELNKWLVGVYQSGINRTESELDEGNRKLTKLRALKSELQAELKTANEKLAKSEDNLKKESNKERRWWPFGEN